MLETVLQCELQIPSRFDAMSFWNLEIFGGISGFWAPDRGFWGFGARSFC
jgi:hypothetical protein